MASFGDQFETGPFQHFFVEFEEPEEPNSRSFFSEIIGTISDVKFSHNGRYLLSRDYLTVKVWDLHMESIIAR